MMREAIRQYIERAEKREACCQAGLKAWMAYEQTGLYLSCTETDAWLKRLANGEGIEPPSCHP